jgi:hypothetical protein
MELSVRTDFTHIVLKHSARSAFRAANYNITKPNIMSSRRNSTTNANHQSDP